MPEQKSTRPGSKVKSTNRSFFHPLYDTGRWQIRLPACRLVQVFINQRCQLIFG
jgi:hypothetical protein